MRLHQIVEGVCQNGFQVIDNFLDAQYYHALRQNIKIQHQSGHLRFAKIGHRENSTFNENIRNDQINWLNMDDDNPAVQAYFAEIQKISTTLNQSLFLGLAEYEAHFAVYQPGAFYKKHIDQFATADDRKISCVYYLNEHWQKDYGGELILYNRNDQLLTNVQPLGNRLICFCSELPHQVEQANHIRYSIAGWLKTRSKQII